MATSETGAIASGEHRNDRVASGGDLNGSPAWLNAI
jgi:hypothetical protein